MATIRLTSKRQATFPQAVCDELLLRPGDELTLEREVRKGKPVWRLGRVVRDVPGWFGCLRAYGRGKRHDMAAIRRSIERERKHGGGE